MKLYKARIKTNVFGAFDFPVYLIANDTSEAISIVTRHVKEVQQEIDSDNFKSKQQCITPTEIEIKSIKIKPVLGDVYDIIGLDGIITVEDG